MWRTLILTSALLSCGATVPLEVADGPQQVSPPPVPKSQDPKPPVKPKQKPMPAGYYRLTVDGHRVRVRIAATADERYRGLSGVARLDPDEGMLFLYQTKVARRFWMKGCLIKLDVAYLSDDHRILSIKTLNPPAKNTPDEKLDRAPSPEPNRLVFEMPGGYFKSKGIKVGAKVVIPKEVLALKVEP